MAFNLQVNPTAGATYGQALDDVTQNMAKLQEERKLTRTQMAMQHAKLDAFEAQGLISPEDASKYDDAALGKLIQKNAELDAIFSISERQSAMDKTKADTAFKNAQTKGLAGAAVVAQDDRNAFNEIFGPGGRPGVGAQPQQGATGTPRLDGLINDAYGEGDRGGVLNLEKKRRIQRMRGGQQQAPQQAQPQAPQLPGALTTGNVFDRIAAHKKMSPKAKEQAVRFAEASEKQKNTQAKIAETKEDEKAWSDFYKAVKAGEDNPIIAAIEAGASNTALSNIIKVLPKKGDTLTLHKSGLYVVKDSDGKIKQIAHPPGSKVGKTASDKMKERIDAVNEQLELGTISQEEAEKEIKGIALYNTGENNKSPIDPLIKASILQQMMDDLQNK